MVFAYGFSYGLFLFWNIQNAWNLQDWPGCRGTFSEAVMWEMFSWTGFGGPVAQAEAPKR
jgi:hypothetical protein